MAGGLAFCVVDLVQHGVMAGAVMYAHVLLLDGKRAIGRVGLRRR